MVDTNVWISAALSKYGNPRRVVDFLSLAGHIVASQDTFEEFESRIRRKRLEKYFPSPVDRETYINWVYALSQPFVQPVRVAACTDPDDDKFLEAALGGQASYVITGNLKDFPPTPFQGIYIVNPAEFVRREITKTWPE
ncbi:MAG: putative toxin-antitoxin system toxin component, PIN family [Bacteroidota bacterium]